MTIVCVPVGRGNWNSTSFQVAGARAAPMLCRPGERFNLGGILWRIVRVEP